jgi:hypothetical protein
MKRFSMSSKSKVAAVLFTALVGSFYVPTIAQAGPGGGDCGDEYGWGSCGMPSFSAASACRGGATGLRTVVEARIRNDDCSVTGIWVEYQCDGQGGGTVSRVGSYTLRNPDCLTGGVFG